MNVLSRLMEPKLSLPEGQRRFSNQELLQLIVPIVMEQLLVLLVGIADTLMVSYAGDAAVSGVSLVNQLNNVFILVLGAIASGGAVVASQYVGRRDQEHGAASSSQLLMIGTVISILMAAGVILLRVPLLNALFGRAEEDVLDASMTYLLISALSFPSMAIYNSTSALLRSMNRTRSVMNVSIVMNLTNVAGNAIGVFALHAGVAGVAVPSLISRIFAAVILLVLCLNRNQPLYIRWPDVFSWEGPMLRRILSIAAPNGIENGLFNLSKVALSSILTTFGTVQIAANGVAQNFWSLAALFSIAFGYAFVTVVGQCVGAGDIPAADYYIKKLLRMTYLGSFLWNAVIMVLTPLVLKFYNLSQETIHLIIILVAIHNLFNSLLCPLSLSLSNGLRAAGDAAYTMFAAIFASVVCRIFLSMVFGVWMDMGVIGLSIAMVLDWLIKAVLIAARYHSRKWTKFQVI